MRLNFMSKFKNRLFSVILSVVMFVGAVTTCLISNSTVQCCKAITPEEMAEKNKQSSEEILYTKL